MQRLPNVPPKPSTDETNVLRYVTSFSNELCQTISQTPIDTRRLNELCQRFESTLAIDEKAVAEIVKQSLEDAKNYGALITSNMVTMQVFRAAGACSRGDDTTGDVDPPGGAVRGGAGGVTDAPTSESTLVINGIQDMTNALIEDCSLNDILSMVLETIFRGLGVTRVLLCITHRGQGKVIARLGLGQNLERFLGKFSIPLKRSNDLFSAAIDKHVDLSFPSRALDRPGAK